MSTPKNYNPISDIWVLVRGAGEMASGVAHRMFEAGFNVAMLEKKEPEFIRRQVCFGEAVHSKSVTIENVTAKLIDDIDETFVDTKFISILTNIDKSTIAALAPDFLIDGRMLKDKTDCSIDLAPCVIGLGPGFTAGKNCDIVIETDRAHTPGKIISKGSAAADSGIPAEVKGYSTERLLRAPKKGVLSSELSIGDSVTKGQIICQVGSSELKSQIDGILRGLIKSGSKVTKGQKVGDVDPSGNRNACFEISDKAGAIGDGTLKAIKNWIVRTAL